MSTPLRGKRSSTDKSNSEKPPWTNPCPGGPTSSSSGTEKRSISEEENFEIDGELLNSIFLTAKHASYQASKFRDNYVWKTFSIEYEKHHRYWKHAKYEWLTQQVHLPIDLGETMSEEELQKLEFDNESIKIYGYLQRLAVAFEQVVKDQKDYNSEFQKEFAEAEAILKSILCELREIIPPAKLDLYQHANREIMPLEFRHMDKHTYRHVRDWLIFRDYMNVVEYLKEVMRYFKNKIV